jgi:hypothetical protein
VETPLQEREFRAGRELGDLGDEVVGIRHATDPASVLPSLAS